MDSKYLVLSDIHGNVSAFEAVLKDCGADVFSGVILLGDCIDYGMRSNEIIQMLMKLKRTRWKEKVIADIWGNHERLVVANDLEHLSSDRGRNMAQYTKEHLSEISIDYLHSEMKKEGVDTFTINKLRCLAVHGSLEDNYWKSITPDDLKGDYRQYDIVFSGHSHYSHCFTSFYPTENALLRNKKSVLFINPGSVGQPRNQNPCAQYAVISLPSKRVELRAVKYDVQAEQALYPKEVDEFYKIRLEYGV